MHGGRDTAAATRPAGGRGVSSSTSPRCAIWGVLNVTPDSFSDGGLHLGAEPSARAVRALLAEGADVLDVGGESTRPRGATYGEGYAHVDADEELRRVSPAIEEAVRLGARVSVDTTKGAVAAAGLAAGASVVNDVSGGADPRLLEAVAAAEGRAELVLMHNRGLGEVTPEHTDYGADVLETVVGELLTRVERAVAAGVPRRGIWLDPGIGFAKTAAQSLELLARTAELRRTGHRVLVGPSRKSFIAAHAPTPAGDIPGPDQRLGGTAAAVVAAVRGGADAVRVHDVFAMRQAVQLAEALAAAAGGTGGTS